MLSIYSSYFQNTGLSDLIELYWNTALLYCTDFLGYLKNSKADTYFQTIGNTFDDFQWNLLQIFTGLVLFNLLSIVFVWKYYGEIICDQFMTNPTLREIEELKASVSKLKLPKEHSPRI